MATVMENRKKERSVMRRIFTRTANDLETSIEQNRIKSDVAILHSKLQELSQTLFKLDELIKDIILKDFEEEELEKELLTAYEYKTRWLSLDAMWNEEISKQKNYGNQRSFKLPKLALQTFDGQLKNWLPFWSQFSKIHDDPTLDEIDKYQYLIQSMKEESEPRKLVEGFPATTYNKCVEQLKGRYAREDLLVQIYIREILSLVLMEKKENITKLYDQLSAHLRSLETLNVMTANYAAFLLPMVESALPNEVLKIWERNRDPGKDVASELKNLLEFLRKEVESEQRLELSKTTFRNTEEEKPLTAECLVSNIKPKKTQTNCVKCIWCDKENHASIECYRLNKLNREERMSLLKEKKTCSICLRKGHHARICRANVKCLICSKRHSTVLCPDLRQEEKEQCNISALASTNQKEVTLLQTLIVEVEVKKKKQKIRALLDSGSQRTYIRKDVVEDMKLTTNKKEILTHILFGGVETKTREYDIYELQVNSLVSPFKIQLSAIAQDNICGNVPKVDPNDARLNHLLSNNKVTLTDKNTNIKEISLLIGADFLGFLLTGAVVQLEDGLVAVNTKLGWTLQGKQVSHCNNIINVLHCACESDLWKLETLGIRDPAEMKSNAEVEAEVIMSFEENIQVDAEGRYEVQLPWKVGFEQLLNNFEVARKRLETTTKKLLMSNNVDTYHNIFQDWREKGIIESVVEPENNKVESHYLPHRAVLKDSSLTTKMRPVFDASARDKNGKSLNSFLEKGVNFLERIPAKLVAFRKNAIGVSSDIAKAFLQISLTPKDRDKLRFLWWEDETRTNIITFRHCRVVFGLTSSPFLLSATIQHHLRKEMEADQQSDGMQHKKTAELLSKSFYVDNCITSLETEDEVIDFIHNSKEIMQKAKMELRQWVAAPMKLNETGQQVISALGVVWDTSTDEIYCNTNSLTKDVQDVTKRVVLSLTQRVFDPIGYTSPIMLLPKLVLREACQRNLTWDERLPSDLQKEFHDWYKWIFYLESCRIPRRLSTNCLDESLISLHLFCDGSKKGYGACVLLRVEKAMEITVQMVAAKSRITPPKPLTIPRIELLAALIGSRLLAQVRQSLDIS